MWWGICIPLCYKFPTESNSEKILKIGQYLVKLWARVWCLFLTHGVVTTSLVLLCDRNDNADELVKERTQRETGKSRSKFDDLRWEDCRKKGPEWIRGRKK